MLSEWLEAGEEAELLVRYLALLAREGYRNVFSDRRASPPLGDRLPVDLELYELARGDVARRNGNGA